VGNSLIVAEISALREFSIYHDYTSNGNTLLKKVKKFTYKKIFGINIHFKN
jgi:hypothetical protein